MILDDKACRVCFCRFRWWCCKTSSHVRRFPRLLDWNCNAPGSRDFLDFWPWQHEHWLFVDPWLLLRTFHTNDSSSCRCSAWLLLTETPLNSVTSDFCAPKKGVFFCCDLYQKEWDFHNHRKCPLQKTPAKRVWVRNGRLFTVVEWSTSRPGFHLPVRCQSRWNPRRRSRSLDISGVNWRKVRKYMYIKDMILNIIYIYIVHNCICLLGNYIDYMCSLMIYQWYTVYIYIYYIIYM